MDKKNKPLGYGSMDIDKFIEDVRKNEEMFVKHSEKVLQKVQQKTERSKGYRPDFKMN